MKKYILRFSQSNKSSRASFKNLGNRSKKIETRAGSPKFKNIQKGERLVLVCGKEKFEKKVKKATTFKTIDSMLLKYKLVDIMPELETKAELKKAYFSYPGYKEKIKKFGLIALEI